MNQPRKSRKELNDISAIILDSAITVHKQLGPGLLESIYQECLSEELRLRQLTVQHQVPLQLHYKGKPIKKDFFIDVLVEGEIILELKSVEELLEVHKAQLITYLKLSNKHLGFLINFNVPLLKDGFKRFVRDF
ncbi:MAG TPA: GxxExxY protein [Chryseosolibacter sp.]